jgi:N6-L-threonylcarbamoyladenine synthase
VVPELASRDHVRTVSRVVTEALSEASLDADALDAIAVTAGPGLVGSLLVGLSFGKALAYRLGLPLVGVHHVEGHLASAELADPRLAPPYVGLAASGAHTALYRVEAGTPPRALGEARDDAVGEAFDKVAKLLGLPYPGGPAIERAAGEGDPAAVEFPRPMLREAGLDFSFSGLKTAVAIEVERRGARAALGRRDVADLAASFQSAAVDVLVTRARQAEAQERTGRVAVVGGVAANRRLRERMQAAAEADGFALFFPPLALCTDNAAMIAWAGAERLARGLIDDLAAPARARWPLDADAPPALGAGVKA